MRYIKHKPAFFIIGVLLFFYFGLPFFDEFISPLGVWLYETNVFNISFIPLKISMLLVNDTTVAVVLQLVLYIISWITLYLLVQGVMGIVRK